MNEGGANNHIGSKAAFAAIPGGHNLMAQSYNQTVMGRYNMALGTSTRFAVAPNDPLVIVGNGSAVNSLSNAFEISNNGHSIVHHTNGTGAVATGAAIIWGTYVDNTILAWGEIDVNVITGVPSISADFGVSSVVPQFMGIYRVNLNITDAYSVLPYLINKASITATLIDDREPTDTTAFCGSISVSKINTTGGIPHFFVRTYGGVTGACDRANRSFMFKVTGRKQ